MTDWAIRIPHRDRSDPLSVVDELARQAPVPDQDQDQHKLPDEPQGEQDEQGLSQWLVAGCGRRRPYLDARACNPRSFGEGFRRGGGTGGEETGGGGGGWGTRR